MLVDSGRVRVRRSSPFAMIVREGRGHRGAMLYVDDYASGFDSVWSFDAYVGNPALLNSPSIAVPFWSIAMALAVPTGVAWSLEFRKRRAVRTGHCPTCNYALSGLPPDTPCPECGKRGQA